MFGDILLYHENGKWHADGNLLKATVSPDLPIIPANCLLYGEQIFVHNKDLSLLARELGFVNKAVLDAKK